MINRQEYEDRARGLAVRVFYINGSVINEDVHVYNNTDINTDYLLGMILYNTLKPKRSSMPTISYLYGTLDSVMKPFPNVTL